MQPPARCRNHRCVYIDQCDYFGGGGFRNINIFGGMKILWIFLGGHDKIGLVLGVSSMYFRVFSYGKCTE